MLAAHLSRLNTRPVRYALDTRDPAMMDAVRNYLNVNLRAEGLPATLRSEPELLGLHRQHPILGQAFHSLMQSGHPADLMAYLDLYDQHGGPYDPADAQDPFSRHLRNFADVIGTQSEHPRLKAMYGQQAMDSPQLQAALAQHMRYYTGHVNNVGRIYDDLPPGHPLRNQLGHVLNHLMAAYGSSPGQPSPVGRPHPAAITRGYDIGHALTTRQLDLSGSAPNPNPLPGAAGVAGRRQQLRDFMGATLQNVLRPQLATNFAGAPGGYP